MFAVSKHTAKMAGGSVVRSPIQYRPDFTQASPSAASSLHLAAGDGLKQFGGGGVVVHTN